VPSEPGAEHDEGKGDGEDEDADESRHCDGKQRAICQRLRADTDHGRGDDGYDRSAKAVEDRGHPCDVAVGYECPRQSEDQKESGQDEEHAGGDAAEGAV
jgi:hypothetical protein